MLSLFEGPMADNPFLMPLLIGLFVLSGLRSFVWNNYRQYDIYARMLNVAVLGPVVSFVIFDSGDMPLDVHRPDRFIYILGMGFGLASNAVDVYGIGCDWLAKFTSKIKRNGNGNGNGNCKK